MLTSSSRMRRLVRPLAKRNLSTFTMMTRENNATEYNRKENNEEKFMIYVLLSIDFR